MRRSPGYTCVAVVSLVLGIAANTTIFSVFNGLLLKPLSGRNPKELVTVYTSDYSGPLYGTSSYPDYLDFKNGQDVFAGLATYTMEPLLLTSPHAAESLRVTGQLVSANYFDVLGVTASSGRTFIPADDSGPAQLVVLNHALWMRLIGGNAGIIGREVQLNGRYFTVVGVAPPDFQGIMRGLQVDIWVPISNMPSLTAHPDALEIRGNRNLSVFGRLNPGARGEQAQAKLNVVAGQLSAAYPQNWHNRHGEPRKVTVLDESRSRILPQAAGPVTLFLRLLMGVVILVLLIACANVANLLLARGLTRQKEMAVRLSQGASRRCLIQQLLTESLILSGLAGIAGILLAAWTSRLLMAFQPPLPVSLSLDLSMDSRVLSFALVLVGATGAAFGLVPALRASRPDLVAALKDEGTGPAIGHRRSLLRGALVAAQVAMSLVLLIGAGLLIRSMANAHAIDTGFDPSNVLLVSMDLKTRGYTDDRGRQFYRELQERIESTPGVEAASFTDRLPLGLDWQRRSMTAEGQQPPPGEDMEHHFATVTPGFFRVMRTPLVRGRAFSPDDLEAATPVVVVSEAFARRFWPSQDPLGKWIVIGGYRKGVPADTRRWTVVGVAADAKYNTLAEDPTPFVFFPHQQEYRDAMTLMVRTSADPRALLGGVRERVRAMDAALPLYGVTTLGQYVGTALVPVRMAATLLAIMAALALVLAAVGIYGVAAHAVGRRTREIGLRMALGAPEGSILRLVLGQALAMTALGLVLGLVAAAGVTRFIAFLLYGIGPLDLLTFAGIPLTLALVALAAGLRPALRATRVAPIDALRHE